MVNKFTKKSKKYKDKKAKKLFMMRTGTNCGISSVAVHTRKNIFISKINDIRTLGTRPFLPNINRARKYFSAMKPLLEDYNENKFL